MGELLSIIPPTCWPSDLGAPMSCGASSAKFLQPTVSRLPANSGISLIFSDRTPMSSSCIRPASIFSRSPGSPRAPPRSRMTPRPLYVETAPVRTAKAGPNLLWTLSMSSSLMALGKSRSMSGRESASSEMNLSKVRSHFRGSTWLMPTR